MKHSLLLFFGIILSTSYATDLILVENIQHSDATFSNSCPFNVVAHKIRHLAMQLCPSTGTLSNNSHHTSHSIQCSDNSEIKHYVLNKCDIITQTPFDHQYYESSVRRRQLLPSLFHSNLAEACISYKISPQQTQTDSISIFLPLCLDSIQSQLISSDIDSLIANKTFRAKTNVKSAVGAHINGEFGILVEVIAQSERHHFKICLQNIVVDTDDLMDSIDIHSIRKSHGIIMDEATERIRKKCGIDGIPCFNFFIQQPSKCVPVTTNDDYNNLKSMTVSTEHNMVEFSSHVGGENNVIYNLMVDLSPSLLKNLWLFVIVILMLMIVIYFCFLLKSSSSSSVDSDDGDISEIIMIV